MAKRGSGGRSSDRPRPHASLGDGFSLGRVIGVEVRIDWSLFVIFALIVFNLGVGVLVRWHPHWTPTMRWSTAIAAATLFFASVLVHELSHALVARAQGMPVRSVTLFLFGGLAQIEAEPPSPRAEFLTAAVGPLVSLAIGIGATLAGAMLAGSALPMSADVRDREVVARALASLGPGATLLLWLGPINVMLGLFNLLPGFPLDGGRVLRAILWSASKDLTKATRWATGAGRFFAWTLMAFGVMEIFAGALGQGLWLVLIGWFLNNAARASYEQQLVRKGLENVSVLQVMRSPLDRVPPWLHVDALVHEHFMATDQQAFPVEDEGNFRGLVSMSDVRKVPQAQWADTAVESIMTPTRELPTLPPDAPAERALEALARNDIDQIPVLQGSQLLGLVRRGDLVRWLALTRPGVARA